MMRLTIAAAVAACAVAAPAAAQDAAGEWVGVLEPAPGVRLPLVLHIAGDAAGGWSGTLDSPAQDARGLPLADIAVADGTLTLAVPSVGGAYRAQWNADKAAWVGKWRQGGMSWPLELAAPRAAAPLAADWRPPGDAEISRLIAERIAPRAGQGLVVGVLAPEGERVVAGGPAEGARFGRDTVFEIGSISKVFTALILADMAAKGEVALDDPAAKYLPEGHAMPAHGGRAITLRDLAQHVSGLPRLPTNMPFGDPDDPYADYTEALMLAFLDGYTPPRAAGAEWEYSNFGAGLLGYLLARAAGRDYPTLLRERITGPLGMADTAIQLSPEQQARLAPGRDAWLRPAKPWHLAALVGAGGIHSTANDMLKFAAAALDPASPIAPAMRLALAERVPGRGAGVEQALGWLVAHPEPGRELLLHDGGTGGYRATLALEPARGTAAVVLANSAAEPSTSDLGVHLLTGAPAAPTPALAPPPTPQVERTAIAVPPAELDALVGRYDFGAGVEFVIARDGDRLVAQRHGALTGPPLPIVPEAPRRFFWTAVDAQIVFLADEDGAVTGAEFTQAGVTLTGKRVEP